MNDWNNHAEDSPEALIEMTEELLYPPLEQKTLKDYTI